MTNSSFHLVELLLITPLLALFFTSIIPITAKVLRGNVEMDSRASLWSAMVGCVAAAGLALTYTASHKLIFMKALVFDGISTFAAIVVIGIVALSLLMSQENRATVGHLFSEHIFMILNCAIGMMIVAWANDLIVLFIGIEYMSLCLYVLIAISNEQKVSKEAAFKYFLLGSFASAVLLFGISFIYGSVGSTYLSDISPAAIELMGKNRLFLCGVGLVLVGLGFKVAAFPFHAWVPDVYQGAPTPVTGYMATGVKVVSFLALLRVVCSHVMVSDRSEALLSLLQWLAVLTMLVGNIAAIMQNNFKRMLAYSGIAHSGYAFIGIIAASTMAQSMNGASSVLFYVFSYSLMTIGAFGCVALFEKDEDSMVEIDDLRGLASKRPWLALCLSVFMLSLAGIPPTIGFFAKFFVFSAAIKQGFFWLAIWGVISSVISLVYYLRPLVVMYMRPEEDGIDVQGYQPLTHFAVSLTALLVLVLGLASSPIYDLVTQSVAHLF